MTLFRIRRPNHFINTKNSNAFTARTHEIVFKMYHVTHIYTYLKQNIKTEPVNSNYQTLSTHYRTIFARTTVNTKTRNHNTLTYSTWSITISTQKSSTVHGIFHIVSSNLNPLQKAFSIYLFTTPSLTTSKQPPSLFLNTDYAHIHRLSVKQITNTQTFHTWNFLDILHTSTEIPVQQWYAWGARTRGGTDHRGGIICAWRGVALSLGM